LVSCGATMQEQTNAKLSTLTLLFRVTFSNLTSLTRDPRQAGPSFRSLHGVS
jgi:hypothetical protein